MSFKEVGLDPRWRGAPPRGMQTPQGHPHRALICIHCFCKSNSCCVRCAGCVQGVSEGLSIREYKSRGLHRTHRLPNTRTTCPVLAAESSWDCPQRLGPAHPLSSPTEGRSRSGLTLDAPLMGQVTRRRQPPMRGVPCRFCDGALPSDPHNHSNAFPVSPVIREGEREVHDGLWCLAKG